MAKDRTIDAAVCRNMQRSPVRFDWAVRVNADELEATPDDVLRFFLEVFEKRDEDSVIRIVLSIMFYLLQVPAVVDVFRSLPNGIIEE